MEHLQTIILGAGQAGLSTSYHLKMRQQDHLVFERDRIGEAWRSLRWDSFTLVTPNWMLNLPGLNYEGTDPGGFTKKAELLRYLEDYSKIYGLPVRTGIEAYSIEPGFEEAFIIRTNRGKFSASNVVIATGNFQKPSIPRFRDALASGIHQIHSSEYRNPDKLVPGGVLVVGSAQSGCQIADELIGSGRKVYLATGGSDRLPRRYRGIDSFWWSDQLGVFNETVDSLPSPAARFRPNPHISGNNGGKTLGLHELAKAGVNLLGRLKAADNKTVFLEKDLRDNIEKADNFEDQFIRSVDRLIEEKGIDLPEEKNRREGSAYRINPPAELDLEKAGVSTIIWATGFKHDYSWIHLPVYDDSGYPVQDQGVTFYPGLYFVGLHWLHTRQSGLLSGVGSDAAHVAEHIMKRNM